MTRGLGEKQRKDRLLTTSKIASYLSVTPFTYEQLQKESKIQRKRLREGLDEMVRKRIVFKHRFSIRKDHNIEYNSMYYLLNWSNNESKQLVQYYFDNPSIENNASRALKKQGNREDKNFVRDKSDQLNTLMKRESVSDIISEEDYQEYIASLAQIQKDFVFKAVEKQVRLNYHEPTDVDVRQASELVDVALNKGYSFLDALIRLSADKIGGAGAGIYRFTKLWEVMEKKGLIRKYANEIPW